MKSSKYWRVNEHVDSIKTVRMVDFQGEILRMILNGIVCIQCKLLPFKGLKSSSYCVSNHILSALTISRASST